MKILKYSNENWPVHLLIISKPLEILFTRHATGKLHWIMYKEHFSLNFVAFWWQKTLTDWKMWFCHVAHKMKGSVEPSLFWTDPSHASGYLGLPLHHTFLFCYFFNNYIWVLALFVPPGSWSCSSGVSQCSDTAQKAKDGFTTSFPSIPWPSSPPLSVTRQGNHFRTSTERHTFNSTLSRNSSIVLSVNSQIVTCALFPL